MNDTTQNKTIKQDRKNTKHLTKRLAILFLFIGASLLNGAIAQPPVNERYKIDGAPSSIFGSVISTDSCYYIAGVHAFSPSYSERKGTFIKMNFDGSINHLSTIENDTMGIDLWEGNNLIPTLDGNFAYMAGVKGENSKTAFMFVKLNPNGDTISTNYINDFYLNREEIGIVPSTLIQDDDSTYYGVVGVAQESDLQGGTVFYKLDKTGALEFDTSFFGTGVGEYHILRPYSLVKFDENSFVIASTLIHAHGIDTEDIRAHTKLIQVDKFGNVLNQHIYWEDSLSTECYGLTKTVDGGLLYCGRNGRYMPITNTIEYKGRIVKLKSDFEVDWEIELGNYTHESLIGLTKVLAVNDSEFVAVGNNLDLNQPSYTGWLIKFNLSGQVLWQRNYIKVPHYAGEANFPTHYLYDVEVTPDNGFIMVGQSTNYHVNEAPIGQMGWIVKTDKFGCIVPRCQLNDTPLTKPGNSVIVIPPDTTSKTDPITWLYPNPTSKSLFYYHHQANFNGGTAYIYNTAGQMVQRWEITENDITYEVDVSQLASGTYIIKVFNMFGEALETERFVKN